MTHFSKTTLRELKKWYLNVLKKCFLVNLIAFGISLPFVANSETIITSRTTSGTAQYDDLTIFKDIIYEGKETLDGGAFYNQYGTISFNNLTKFINNQVAHTEAISGYSFTENGGAIYNDSGTINFNDVLFDGNIVRSVGGNSAVGGAIYNSAKVIFNGNSEFKNNSLNANSARGGAINNTDSIQFGNPELNIETLSNLKTLFINNFIQAHNGAGGAIKNLGDITFSTYVLFDANYIKSTTDYGSIGGGAIDNYGDIIFNSNTEFKNNRLESKRAASGGAISN